MAKWWVVWGGGTLGICVRFLLVVMGSLSLLDRRVEVVSPVTSLSRLAEGYWLKEYGKSPYAGSAYHGSPLLLSLIGPVIGDRQDTSIGYLLCRSYERTIVEIDWEAFGAWTFETLTTAWAYKSAQRKNR